MEIPGGYSKFPHIIYKELADMSLPEAVCTLVLVRETFGWHRADAFLPIKYFKEATSIRSKTTVRAALYAIEARGFFQRTSRRSVWRIGEAFRAAEDDLAAPAEFAEEDAAAAPNAFMGSPSGVKGPESDLVPANDEQDKIMAAAYTSILEEILLLAAQQTSVSEEHTSVSEGHTSISETYSSVSETYSSVSEQRPRRKGPKSDPNFAAKGPESDPQSGPKGSPAGPFLYNKETPKGGSEESEGEKKVAAPHTHQPLPADDFVPEGHEPPKQNRKAPAGHRTRGATPRPRSAKQRALAAHPATGVWLDICGEWPGWHRLKLITRRLGRNPDKLLLAKAWEMWIMSGYRTNNYEGILDWYDELSLNPAWKPGGTYYG